MNFNENPHKILGTSRYAVFICLFLVVVTLIVYLQVASHGFVTFDDGLYITENIRVRGGITLENIAWSFTTTHSSNWHPLTWMSHMLDVSLFGMHPGSHHLVSLFFHLANSLLLFFVFRQMTGDIWQSAFVAALFAIHPLHVESVAWVSERKDVLSTFFGMLTLLSYVSYARYNDKRFYLTALLFFILGLMAKPMLVTLPFVLLLLDYWPLCRMKFKKLQQKASNANIKISFFDLVIEKIPFFTLTAASCVVTFYAQRSGGSLATLEVFPLESRIANAAVAYVDYIAKMLWPVHLSAFYPHPYSLPVWQVAGSALLLMLITWMCIRSAKQRPYLPVGWLFYLGTLFPVIGLIQVGEQAMADRYTYVPLIGVFIMLAWGVPDLLAKWRHKKKVFVFGSALLFPALMLTTWLQVRHWSDSVQLYEHMIKVTRNNFMAHYNLGVYLAEHDQISKAIEHYRKALSIKSGHVNANINLGNTLVIQGKFSEAIPYYTNALNRVPNDPEIHNNIGVALLHAGKTGEAIGHFKTALKIRPHYIGARKNLQKAEDKY
jgi:tetratricopeptide (TPR) repeat protein